MHIDMHTRVARARRDLVHMAGRVAATRAALSGRWRISLEIVPQSTIFTPIFSPRRALRARAPLRGGMHIPTHITKVGSLARATVGWAAVAHKHFGVDPLACPNTPGWGDSHGAVCDQVIR